MQALQLMHSSLITIISKTYKLMWIREDGFHFHLFKITGRLFLIQRVSEYNAPERNYLRDSKGANAFKKHLRERGKDEYYASDRNFEDHNEKAHRRAPFVCSQVFRSFVARTCEGAIRVVFVLPSYVSDQHGSQSINRWLEELGT